ncbi:hypothetical protein RUM43_011783 [Polyplax serrata]|uniref:Uncharacterized protein n=1 Tax=Polyplax serrata TaxID=468196 RepID=A0AAN8P5V4_POLSC
MVPIKYLGVVVAFHLFVVCDAYSQSFYAVRYGKRGDNGETAGGGRRLGRRDDETALADRKIRFFISGGRYGKRGYVDNKYTDGSRELVTSGFDDFRNPHEVVQAPSRRSQFRMGSRFGKRHREPVQKDERPLQDPWCIFPHNKNFYRCSSTSDSAEMSRIQSSEANASEDELDA